METRRGGIVAASTRDCRREQHREEKYPEEFALFPTLGAENFGELSTRQAVEGSEEEEGDEEGNGQLGLQVLLCP